jgi:hypothetical protein
VGRIQALAGELGKSLGIPCRKSPLTFSRTCLGISLTSPPDPPLLRHALGEHALTTWRCAQII